MSPRGRGREDCMGTRSVMFREQLPHHALEAVVTLDSPEPGVKRLDEDPLAAVLRQLSGWCKLMRVPRLTRGWTKRPWRWRSTLSAGSPLGCH